MDKTDVQRIIREEPLTDRERLVRILEAFEGAQGIPIPYPLAVRMAEVVKDLRAHADTLPRQGAYDADVDNFGGQVGKKPEREYDAYLGDMR